MSIGFIGLGIMGDGMSRCLLKKGDKLAVWNRSPAKCEALKAEYPDSVTICKTPAEVITTCQLTFVMLSTPEAVKEVYEAEGTGILAGLATALEDMADGVGSGKQIVDCATLAVTDMERLFSQVHGKQATFLEAPVSGSKGPAAQGQLIFLCGGSETLYTAIGPHLDAMGKAKFFLGPVGAGTKMKLCVNMTMGSMLAAYGEGLSLATSSGLDSKQLLEVPSTAALSTSPTSPPLPPLHLSHLSTCPSLHSLTYASSHSLQPHLSLSAPPLHRFSAWASVRRR